MKIFSPGFLILFFLFLFIAAEAQQIDSSLLQKQWNAYWITVPGAEANGYGVYFFRKKIDVNTKPSSFVVHVSADNRYKLFVNETLVSIGPARGDLTHWNFETLDIAPYLQTGQNIITAQVWNEGDYRPEAQITFRTGFILQGNGSSEQAINTDSSWLCVRDSSYQPLPVSMPGYYVAGAGEVVTMSSHIKNPTKLLYPDSVWKKAQLITKGDPKNSIGGYGTRTGWMLVPSGIPQRELTQQRLLRLRKAEGIAVPSSFPATQTNVTIPANTIATLLLDQTFLTNAYPTIVFSGGKNAAVTLTYAEALFTHYPQKGNRDEIDGKLIMGRKDSLLSDGSDDQKFTSLAFRTYRYLQIKVTTQLQPLVLTDVYGTFTGYPFQLNAKLQSGDADMDKMLQIGWRTARLCAVETYTDCPYYEQLQYIGDTRIQGLVSLYNSGDDRLLKNALNQMDNSRQPEGITESRHPSFTSQYIPTFSLWYIGMLHDFMMYDADSIFLKNKLPGERDVLTYFHRYQQADGSLQQVPYWMFTDWVTAKDWNAGVAPVSKDGTSALFDLQLLWAYELAADMESKFGMKEYASLYNKYAAQLKTTIRQKYWNNVLHLFADRQEKDLYSQHANALAILTSIATGKEAADISQRLLADTSLAPASIYFKYYLHQALIQAGLGNDYLSWLTKWRENMSLGLTTWAEMSDVNASRSDCHAWGASPNIEFFRTVLGINSDAPGFAKVKIEPHLGALQNIGGEMPHPNGTIAVSYHFINDKWRVKIDLPAKTNGSLVWKGKPYSLREGANSFTL